MAERSRDERLEELRNKGVTIYSISRIDSINNCLYGAYRTYILGERGKDNVYSALGSRIHQTLEDIENDLATEEDLMPAMQAELDNLDALGIEFPKDKNGNDSIRDGWIADMTHFCETYKAPRAKLKTEELFIYTTSKGYVLQGYIDAQRNNKDGSISIYDYKTSTKYSGTDESDHGRQLVVYQMGKEQEGKTVRDVAWIFLKYCEIQFMGKKTVKSKEKSLIKKVIERKKIGSEMAKYVEQDLYEQGIDGIDAEIIINELKTTNKFDCLPDSIRDNYKMIPCVHSYKVTDEIKRECEDYINRTIEMWESLGDDVKNYPPRKFTKIQKNGKEVPDYFFCTNLCSHFEKCPYIHEYLDKMSNSSNEDDDLF